MFSDDLFSYINKQRKDTENIVLAIGAGALGKAFDESGPIKLQYSHAI